MTGPTAAEALCNNLATNYAGQYSQGNGHSGLERFISKTDPKLSDPNNQHIAFWVDVDDNPPANDHCNPAGTDIDYCWVQVGHGMGLAGDGSGVETSLTPYFEASQPTSPNVYIGYTFKFHDEFALVQNDFYTTFYTGTTVYGYPEFEGDLNNGSVRFLGNALLWKGYGHIQAEAEMYNPESNNCPAIDVNNHYAYFGTDGSGTYNSGTELYTYDGSPLSWSEWTSAVTRPANYENDLLKSNSAFKVRGGSG